MLGALGSLLQVTAAPRLPGGSWAAVAAICSLTGAWLLLGARSDPRPMYLGGFFLSVASAFAYTPSLDLLPLAPSVDCGPAFLEGHPSRGLLPGLPLALRARVPPSAALQRPRTKCCAGPGPRGRHILTGIRGQRARRGPSARPSRAGSLLRLARPGPRVGNPLDSAVRDRAPRARRGLGPPSRCARGRKAPHHALPRRHRLRLRARGHLRVAGPARASVQPAPRRSPAHGRDEMDRSHLPDRDAGGHGLRRARPTRPGRASRHRAGRSKALAPIHLGGSGRRSPRGPGGSSLRLPCVHPAADPLCGSRAVASRIVRILGRDPRPAGPAEAARGPDPSSRAP